jgi:hypothetical protein
MTGEGAVVTMSHAVAVLCIQVPMFDTTPAIQMARKTFCRKGLQAVDEGPALPPESELAWAVPSGSIRKGMISLGVVMVGETIELVYDQSAAGGMIVQTSSSGRDYNGPGADTSRHSICLDLHGGGNGR